MSKVKSNWKKLWVKVMYFFDIVDEVIQKWLLEAVMGFEINVPCVCLDFIEKNCKNSCLVDPIKVLLWLVLCSEEV